MSGPFHPLRLLAFFWIAAGASAAAKSQQSGCPEARASCVDAQVTARGAEDESALLADDECRTEGSESLPHGISGCAAD